MDENTKIVLLAAIQALVTVFGYIAGYLHASRVSNQISKGP
jgi:uncharacterized membrane protein YqaE (UPF0057 family)